MLLILIILLSLCCCCFFLLFLVFLWRRKRDDERSRLSAEARGGRPLTAYTGFHEMAIVTEQDAYKMQEDIKPPRALPTFVESGNKTVAAGTSPVRRSIFGRGRALVNPSQDPSVTPARQRSALLSKRGSCPEFNPQAALGSAASSAQLYCGLSGLRADTQPTPLHRRGSAPVLDRRGSAPVLVRGGDPHATPHAPARKWSVPLLRAASAGQMTGHSQQAGNTPRQNLLVTNAL